MTQEVRFPVGALVRVARQPGRPGNQFPKIVGDVGFVREVCTEDREFYSIREDGSMCGCGYVPVSCLEDASGDAEVVRRKALYDARQTKFRTEHEAWATKLKAGLESLSLKYGIPVETIQQIASDVASLYP